MEKVIVVGAGGHGAELDEYIRQEGRYCDVIRYQLAGFLDDNADNYKQYAFSAPYLGSIQDHEVDSDCNYLMGIANLKFRKEIAESLIKKGARFLTYIHPGAFVSESAKIGKGVVISYNCTIGPNAEIGDFSMINARASIAHDSKVGSFNFIGPNVCLSGFTSVGNENLFGINSATIPGIKIGNRNKISAGMTLDKNVDDDSVVFYKMKERVISIPKKAE
jgi:sugar O-acyltransferase (sialic acid O-acetyltransferase NeuD family)